MNTYQKAGGLAALAHAFAYLVGIGIAVTLIFPVLEADTAKYIEFVAENQFLMHIWILIIYWGSAISVIVMALALYNRMSAKSPALMQIATAFGIIWAGLIIASGNLMLNDFHVITGLYTIDPAQAATAWTILEAVENGITSGNELVGSLWVMLVEHRGNSQWRSSQIVELSWYRSECCRNFHTRTGYYLPARRGFHVWDWHGCLVNLAGDRYAAKYIKPQGTN